MNTLSYITVKKSNTESIVIDSVWEVENRISELLSEIHILDSFKQDLKESDELNLLNFNYPNDVLLDENGYCGKLNRLQMQRFIEFFYKERGFKDCIIIDKDKDSILNHYSRIRDIQNSVDNDISNLKYHYNKYLKQSLEYEETEESFILKLSYHDCSTACDYYYNDSYTNRTFDVFNFYLRASEVLNSVIEC